MIGVVIPAHNEALLLPACLTSILNAARHPGLAGETVKVVVVLDACTDESALVAESFGVETLDIHVVSVGKARAAGANSMVLAGARWLSFTDADSRVPPDWLVAQVNANSDAVCGTVMVDDWEFHSPTVRRRYEMRYHFCDGHPHVHGANLGVSVEAYLLAGGFPPLNAHEDVALVDQLVSSGASVARLASPCVVTSSRLEARAPEGFAGFLRNLDEARS